MRTKGYGTQMNADAAQMNVRHTACVHRASGCRVANDMIRFWGTFICVLLFAFICVPRLSLAASPDIPSEDPFRYLEDRNDPRTQEFFRTQAEQAKAQLAALPGRQAMLARIRTLSEAATSVTDVKLAARRVFYLRQSPGTGQPRLCMREGTSGTERVLLDPSRYDDGPLRAAIDWYAPSPDGRHVAYGVSRGGDEASVLRVLAADGARDLGVEIDRTRFNTELEWHPDGRSFYYSRIPAGNTGARANANIRVYRHMLGRAAASDEVVFAPGVGGARDVPEFVYPSLHLPLESRHAYAVVRDGVRRELAVHVTEQRDLAAGRPRWRKLAGVEDEVLAIEGWKNELYVLSKKGAPNHRVLRVAAEAASMAGARVVVPENDVVVRSMGLAADALYLRTMEGGVDRLERVPIGLLGRLKKPEFLRTPFDSSITQLIAHPTIAGVLLRLQGWIDGPRIMQLDARSGEIRDTRLQPAPTADYSGMDEVRLYAPGHDGVRIPVTLIYAKTTRLTGDNPTLLTGYGAYGITQSPSFDPARLAWLERGGVYAIAHIRGGGEYGERWHLGGRGATKINTIRDFISVSEFLVSYGFTNPKRLAILGRSAGGIPVGGAIVRRPELFAAAVAQVPVMDMLRAELTPNGPANIPEFGSAATPAGAENLLVMSAYHHVKEATPYPAVLFTVGYNDARVEPWQPGKMAGRLQAATTSGRPVLLRVDFESGHGRGMTRARRAEELADVYSFVLWQLGDPEFAPVPVSPPPAPPEAPAETPSTVPAPTR
jgi:prolyl oligopeptidase